MTPHLASLGNPKNGKTGILSSSSPLNINTPINSPVPSGDCRNQSATIEVAESAWKSRRLIVSIIGCEVGVLLALLSVIFHGESDPREFISRLAILFVALLGLSMLRRNALPTESERSG